MVRCAITDRSYRAGDATRWAGAGVDYIQLRDKTLDAATLAALARNILAEMTATGSDMTRLLINSRVDVAMAAGAAGVHLTAHPDEQTPRQVREAFRLAGRPEPVIGVSCHTLDEVERASEAGGGFILFGPVFEKQVEGKLVSEGVGLELLHQACAAAGKTPVLALGGVTPENTSACIAAGAAGVAGIRLFA